MKIFGYIEGDQLRCCYLEPYTDRQEFNGKIIEREVSEEEQAKALSEIWKPVDFINDDIMASAKEGETIFPQPYDAGDHIAYRYVRMKDKQHIRAQIASLKEELAASDYKITKCYEATLLGAELPYDIQELHQQRQELRDRINALTGNL